MSLFNILRSFIQDDTKKRFTGAMQSFIKRVKNNAEHFDMKCGDNKTIAEIISFKILNNLCYFNDNKPNVVNEPIISSDVTFDIKEAITEFDVCNIANMVSIYDNNMFWYYFVCIDKSCALQTDIIMFGDAARFNARLSLNDMLNEAFPNYAIMPTHTKYKICKFIEGGCYKQCKKIIEQRGFSMDWDKRENIHIYNLTFLKIARKLDKNSESYEPDQIYKDIIHLNYTNLARRGALSTFKLTNTEKVRKIRETLNVRFKTDIKVGVTNLYKCNTCGHNEMKKEEYYARSLDEASTTLLVCKKCNSTMRF